MRCGCSWYGWSLHQHDASLITYPQSLSVMKSFVCLRSRAGEGLLILHLYNMITYYVCYDSDDVCLLKNPASHIASFSISSMDLGTRSSSASTFNGWANPSSPLPVRTASNSSGNDPSAFSNVGYTSSFFPEKRSPVNFLGSKWK